MQTFKLHCKILTANNILKFTFLFNLLTSMLYLENQLEAGF